MRRAGGKLRVFYMYGSRLLLRNIGKEGRGTNREKQTPHNLLPKLFGELRKRYESRPGGYTRVLRTEPKSRYDQGDSAILELVDGPKDLRFAMTAAAVARDKRLGRPSNELTLLNRAKVIRYRPNGKEAFDDMVKRVADLGLGGRSKAAEDVDGISDLPASSISSTDSGTTRVNDAKDMSVGR